MRPLPRSSTLLKSCGRRGGGGRGRGQRKMVGGGGGAARAPLGRALHRRRVAGAHLVGKVLQRIAAPHEHARLAVLRKDLVIGAQRHGRADVDALLAAVRHVEGDAPLPLRVVEDAVHRRQPHHRAVHGRHRRAVARLGWQRRQPVRAQPAVLVHQTKCGHRHLRARRVHVQRRDERQPTARVAREGHSRRKGRSGRSIAAAAKGAHAPRAETRGHAGAPRRRQHLFCRRSFLCVTLQRRGSKAAICCLYYHARCRACGPLGA